MTETTLDERGSIDGDTYDVLIVGGGVAGLMAATFTARAGLETLLANAGESILRRNAHLENVPGFPLGVNPRLFADMLQSQATHAGANLVTGRVSALDGSLAETFTA
ncbi:MAG: FAD-binding protein, partial [Halobacteriota archaeon]